MFLPYFLWKRLWKPDSDEFDRQSTRLLVKIPNNWAQVKSIRKFLISAGIVIIAWNFAAMLFIFAYSCNLRSSLIYKPTTDPIENFAVS